MENSSTGIEKSIMNPHVPITQLQQLAAEPAGRMEPPGTLYSEISMLGWTAKNFSRGKGHMEMRCCYSTSKNLLSCHCCDRLAAGAYLKVWPDCTGPCGIGLQPQSGKKVSEDEFSRSMRCSATHAVAKGGAANSSSLNSIYYGVSLFLNGVQILLKCRIVKQIPRCLPPGFKRY